MADTLVCTLSQNNVYLFTCVSQSAPYTARRRAAPRQLGTAARSVVYVNNYSSSSLTLTHYYTLSRCPDESSPSST
ncbi:hypothetical protein B9Z55_001438 [Caenorhabditis nigoni]|uniref:Uncharacterized protein n=1 Tax=Caenorhabditis nigoni TaxID=1611254 RepID=A0A2G5VFY0_9PELO|nr:hypothetical protein B9Z55_001438 [Caenorhabditis nigoni]